MRINRKTWLSASDGNSFGLAASGKRKDVEKPFKTTRVASCHGQAANQKRFLSPVETHSSRKKSTWKYSKHKYSRQVLSSDQDIKIQLKQLMQRLVETEPSDDCVPQSL